jgi:hypothetical protein
MMSRAFATKGKVRGVPIPLTRKGDLDVLRAAFYYRKRNTLGHGFVRAGRSGELQQLPVQLRRHIDGEPDSIQCGSDYKDSMPS